MKGLNTMLQSEEKKEEKTLSVGDIAKEIGSIQQSMLKVYDMLTKITPDEAEEQAAEETEPTTEVVEEQTETETETETKETEEE